MSEDKNNRLESVQERRMALIEEIGNKPFSERTEEENRLYVTLMKDVTSQEISVKRLDVDQDIAESNTAIAQSLVEMLGMVRPNFGQSDDVIDVDTEPFVQLELGERENKVEGVMTIGVSEMTYGQFVKGEEVKEEDD